MPVKQRSKSLSSRNAPLSEGFYQLQVLNNTHHSDPDLIPSFHRTLTNHGHQSLKPLGVATLQINIGKKCNQSCAHCHVDAGPDRTEMMSVSHLEKCLEIASMPEITTVDITGGAPELHTHFKWFVEECYKLGVEVIDRCNLTIITSNKKYRELPSFFAKNQVHLISSLPHFSKRRTDSQRGDGVFESSIEALKMLNAIGYGMADSDLKLDLVYNPTGHFLPDSQSQLEAEFKAQLERRNGVFFNQLFVITNMPISRFLEYLLETGNYAEYMQKLLEAFNPGTIEGLMCRNMISVSWDGYIYDCDFNQMLDMKVKGDSQHIDSFDLRQLRERSILTGPHCYGCTAGAGSSCGGEIS